MVNVVRIRLHERVVDPDDRERDERDRGERRHQARKHEELRVRLTFMVRYLGCPYIA